MYKKGAGNDKQGKNAGSRTLCPYRNFSQAIKFLISTLRNSQLYMLNFAKLKTKIIVQHDLETKETKRKNFKAINLKVKRI